MLWNDKYVEFKLRATALASQSYFKIRWYLSFLNAKYGFLGMLARVLAHEPTIWKVHWHNWSKPLFNLLSTFSYRTL